MTNPGTGKNNNKSKAFEDKFTEQYPSAKTVTDFHRNSDVDTRSESQHHTLGTGRTNSSPGDHKHDGGSSLALMPDIIFSGVITSYNKSVLKQIMAALVQLGATDTTSG